MLPEEDPLIVKLTGLLDTFGNKLDDCVHKHIDYVKAHKKTDEIKSRLLHERKLKRDLQSRREALASKDCSQLCAQLSETLTIAPSDQRRLDASRLQLQTLKEMTGVRWDHSTPLTNAQPHGYFRDEVCRSLVPFWSGSVSDLWELLHRDTENSPPNNH